MGLAKTMGWTGFDSWLDPRRNSIIGLGAGIASGENFGQGVANGLQLAQQGKVADDAYATQQKAEQDRQNQLNQTIQYLQQSYPDLAKMVEAGMPANEAWQAAMQRGQPGQTSEFDQRFAAGQKFGLEGESLNNFALTGSLPGVRNSNVTFGLTPIWGEYTDESGQKRQGYVVQGSDGSTKPVELPGGFSPTNPYDLAQQKAGGGTMGKQQATVAASLPGLETNVGIALDAVKRIRDNKQGLVEHFSQAGVLPRDMYVMPGSALGNLTGDLDQVLGQSFMQARQGLKGGGQITDYEGRKAEEAYSRMRAAYQRGDAGAFEQSLAEFERYLTEGYEKLKAFAEGAYEPGGSAPSGDVDSILKQYGL